MADEVNAKEREMKPILVDFPEPIFNGRYGEPFYKLDGGNRLTVPLSVLLALGNKFVVFRDIVNGRFYLYPTEKWDARSRRMRKLIREKYPDDYDDMEEVLISNESREMEMEIFPCKNKIQLSNDDVAMLGVKKGDRITLLGKWDCIELRRTDLIEQRKVKLPDAKFMTGMLRDD